MSVSPPQNSSKPSPVPGPSTEMLTSGLSALKPSAAAELMGSTVEEPEMTTSPETPDSGSPGVPPASSQAAIAAAKSSSGICT